MFFWRNRVGIQSGPSRDPIGHQFLHFWAPLLASRDPIGIQSGSSRAPIFEFLAPRLDLSGSSQNHPKTCKNTTKMLFFMNLAASRHWCPTGSRLAKSGAQKCKNWCPTGSRRDPDWIHRSARTHSRTYFSLPRPTLAPIFLFRAPAVHQYPPLLYQNGKSSLKPNGGSTTYIHIYIYIPVPIPWVGLVCTIL